VYLVIVLKRQGERQKEAAGKLYSFHDSLLNILDLAIHATGAVKGNVQLLDHRRGGLYIAAQRGFDAPFLQLFQYVRVDDPAVCGRAFRQRHRVIVPDITTDIPFSPYLSIARSNGFQSVQSTPILAYDGSVQGVLSTHFAQANFFSEKMAGPLDRCVSKIAALIAGHETDEYLQTAALG
jgi:GAF domain-containing protein